MNTQEIETQLTPAAKVALNELVEDYRQQLLLNAARTAARATGSVEEISVRDIVASAERYSTETKFGVPIRRRKYLYITAIVGLMYMIAGIAYWFYTSTQISHSQLVGLTVAVVGAVLSLVSYLLARTTKERFTDYFFSLRSAVEPLDFDTQNAELQLIKRWTTLELLSRDLLASLLGESRANISLSQVMNFLAEKNIWDKQDYYDAIKLLEMRNSILHKGSSYERSEVAKAMAVLERLIRKIEAHTKNADV